MRTIVHLDTADRESRSELPSRILGWLLLERSCLREQEKLVMGSNLVRIIVVLWPWRMKLVEACHDDQISEASDHEEDNWEVSLASTDDVIIKKRAEQGKKGPSTGSGKRGAGRYLPLSLVVKVKASFLEVDRICDLEQPLNEPRKRDPENEQMSPSWIQEKESVSIVVVITGEGDCPKREFGMILACYFGSHNVLVFGGGLQKAAWGEVFVPVMNEPLGCQQVNFTSIFGEYNDTPPLLAMDFHRMMKGGVVIDHKHSLILFHDEPRRAGSFPQGPCGLQMISLTGHPLQESDSHRVFEEVGDWMMI